MSGFAGFFVGFPVAFATVRRLAARWVSAETWHGQQVASFDKDGSYLLEFDYNQDPELVMEIMKHGDGVEVIGPASLKTKVRAELEKALKNYAS